MLVVMFICAVVILAQMMAPVQAAEPVKVTPETFIRAETDRMFYSITNLPGSGINKFYHNRKITPLDQQTVVRMNRDVLYSGAIVDVSKGATIRIPEIEKGRYASILVVDNDHYCPTVIYTPGKHKLPQDTKYLMLALRIQVFNPKDAAELALVNKLQDQFVVEANSAEPFAQPLWDKTSLDSLRKEYETEFSKFNRYPDDWMGPRGTLNEKTRMYAVAGAYGLFPNKDATYINYNGGNLSGDNCYVATYKVPDVGAFWSITLYGNDGYMKSENSVINASNVKYNEDKTFTVYFGAKDKCPADAKNRLDITDGWNFLMRAYLPGKEILDGTYKLSDVKKINDTVKQTTPADFGVSDVAYKVSESDFNCLRSLAKAPVNQWAHQDDVSRVKTQQVIRENQDVIYSSAVVDISKGATISLPKSDTYQVIQILDLLNYTVKTVYPGESIYITPDNVTYGNYVYLNMRTRLKTNDQKGLDDVHQRQRKAIIQANSAIPYTSPNIVISQKKMEEIRMALIKDINEGKSGSTTDMMGTPYTTSPQGHLYATAYGWGGLPIADAGYMNLINNTKIADGKPVPSSITFTPPELDYARGGFWSITTYNAEGWLAEDKAAISNSEATPNADGTYTIYFNTPGQKNNINTPAKFSALLRTYVPKSKESIIEYMAKVQKDLVIK